MHKIILTENSLRCTLHLSWNNIKLVFVFKSNGNMYDINGRTAGVLLSAVARLNWAIPTSPDVIHIFVVPPHSPLLQG